MNSPRLALTGCIILATAFILAALGIVDMRDPQMVTPATQVLEVQP